jgi:hypothetical protein
MERRNIREAIQEAENKPLEFQPKERAQYIRDMVKAVEDYAAAGKSSVEIKALVPEFARDYTNLFEMILRPGYNKQTLKTMLSMLDRMANGEMTQHQASMVVGERLANTFIKPNLPQ